MAYHGQTPWHGLGNQLKKGATTDEALVSANLNWGVRVTPVWFQADGKRHKHEGHRVMYRDDTNEVFDVVGPDYVPFQNLEIVDFFAEYVAAGDMYIETLGSLNGGRDIWCLAKMGESFSLAGKDKVEGYVFIMNPHRYGKGAVAKFTQVRIVCFNTLMMALRGQGDSIRLWHTTEFNKERQQEAKTSLGIARDQMEAAKKEATQLAHTELTPRQAIDVAASVMGGTVGGKREEQNPRTSRILDLYDGEGIGSKLASAENTAWGLLNAVSQYVDHEYGRSQNNRLTYSWLHGGSNLKNKAKLELLALGN